MVNLSTERAELVPSRPRRKYRKVDTSPNWEIDMAGQFLVAFVASLHALFHIVATQFQINAPQQPLVIWSCGSRLSHRRGIVRERELSVAPNKT